MRKIILALFLSLCGFVAAGQEADAILGDYHSKQNADEYKVRVTRNANGTYKAQIFWVKDDVDPATGKKFLDTKNPSKALRNVACDRIVLFDGLQYNAARQRWDGTKIYDPQRGIRANAVVTRDAATGMLSVKGSLLGISETVIWTRL